MSRVEPPDLPPDRVMRALDGDPVAFNELYQRYDPTVRFAVGRRIQRWPELVPQLDDIVQEVWYELTRRGCKRLRYHDRSKGVPLCGFLRFVAAQYAWRIAKRCLRHPEVEIVEVVDEASEGFAQRLMDAELAERLVALARAELGATDWGLFEGYYVRGDKLTDVAASLGITEANVYQRHKRMLDKLGKLVQKSSGGGPAKVPPELVAVVLAALAATGPCEPSRSDGTAAGPSSTVAPAVEVEHE